MATRKEKQVPAANIKEEVDIDEFLETEVEIGHDILEHKADPVDEDETYLS